MKRKIIQILIILSITQCASKSLPGQIPFGEWDYNLLMNNILVGKATITSSVKEKKYISTISMSMDVGQITNTTKQIITETTEFKPIKLEIYNKIITGNNTQEINTIAIFNGSTVELNASGTKSTINIKKPFILAGNFFIDSLIKKKFKKGTEIESQIYEPTIEIDEPIPVKSTVVGRESIIINNKKQDVIHLTQTIGNFKSIDYYVNEKGVLQKAVIRMLNNKIELVIKP